MGTTGAVTGTIKIGSAALTEISLAISPETEDVSNHVRQKLTIASSAASAAIEQGGITTIAFIWIKSVKASDGTTPLPLAVKINAGSLLAMGSHSEILLVCNPKANALTTAIELAGHASENAIVEYILAGD